MNKRCFFPVYLPLALLVLGGVAMLLGHPRSEGLRVAYFTKTPVEPECRTYSTPTAPAEQFERVVRCDQTLHNSRDRSIIQRNMYRVGPAGLLMFEGLTLYRIDRRTQSGSPHRAIVSGQLAS